MKIIKMWMNSGTTIHAVKNNWSKRNAEKEFSHCLKDYKHIEDLKLVKPVSTGESFKEECSITVVSESVEAFSVKEEEEEVLENGS